MPQSRPEDLKRVASVAGLLIQNQTEKFVMVNVEKGKWLDPVQCSGRTGFMAFLTLKIM